MSTGVTKNERVRPDTLTATILHREPHPLPQNTTEAILVYPGKLEKSIILKPASIPYCSVDPVGKIEKNEVITPNAMMLSDNFFALHTMFEQNIKATLVYLDPPFATGRDFHSRQLDHAYTDKLGSAAYLEFMRRRLILLREILTEDGSIYLHIGHQMVGHIKVLMDEIFGKRNCKNIITRRKCSSKNSTKKQFANIHDFILFYTRSAHYKWNPPGEIPDAEWIAREYPKVNDRGQYKLGPIHAPGTRNGETGEPWRGKMPPKGKHWQLKPSKLEELDKQGEIHWSCNGNPRRKIYLTAEKRLAFTDYWGKFRDAHHQSIKITGYPTEKNLDMLKIIVGASTDKGDLVVDPFCGSGTTLDAANQCGRPWVGIDESFVAAKATINRLCKGAQAMGDYVQNQNNKKKEPDNLTLEGLNGMHTEQIAPKPMGFNFYIDTELIETYKKNIEELFSL